MFAVEIILDGVLLVEDLEIFNTGGDRMVLVLDAHGESVGFGMAAVIAAEELVVETARGVDALGVVQRQEGSAVVDEIPNGLLLRVGHPFYGRLVVAVRPVHSIAQDDKELVVA